MMMGGEPIEKSNEDDTSIWGLCRHIGRQFYSIFIQWRKIYRIFPSTFIEVYQRVF